MKDGSIPNEAQILEYGGSNGAVQKLRENRLFLTAYFQYNGQAVGLLYRKLKRLMKLIAFGQRRYVADFTARIYSLKGIHF